MIRPKSAHPRPQSLQFSVCAALVLTSLPAIRSAPPLQDLELVRQAVTLVTSTNSETRQLALLEVTNPALLRELARTEKDIDVRRAAILMLTDQAELQQLALAPETRVREAAVSGIIDETFLVKRVCLGGESSPTVRDAIVGALRTQDTIAQVAETSYFRDVRTAAAERVTDFALAAKVKAVQDAIAAQAKSPQRDAVPARILEQALNGSIDVLGQAAAWQLAEQADLANVALASRNREVLKVVFNRLNDPILLKQVAAEAAETPMRLAAARKAGLQSWDEIFNGAATNAGSSPTLGDALAAVALFDGVQSDAASAVRRGCKAMIEHGDESRVPEMADLFALYGDFALGGEFFQSGQPDWEKVAVNWAKAMGHNYETPWRKKDSGR